MNQAELIAEFILAGLFRAARLANGTPCTAKDAFNDAEAFIKEAKQRGINLENLK